MPNSPERTPGTPEQARPFRLTLENPNTQRYALRGLMRQLNALTEREARGRLSQEELRTTTLELAKHLGVTFAPEQKRDMGVQVEEIPAEKWQEWLQAVAPGQAFINQPFARQLAYLRQKHQLS